MTDWDLCTELYEALCTMVEQHGHPVKTAKEWNLQVNGTWYSDSGLSSDEQAFSALARYRYIRERK